MSMNSHMYTRVHTRNYVYVVLVVATAFHVPLSFPLAICISLFHPLIPLFSPLLSPTVIRPFFSIHVCTKCVCVCMCCLYVHLPGHWFCNGSMTVRERLAISTWVLIVCCTCTRTKTHAGSLTSSLQWHTTAKPHLSLISLSLAFFLFLSPSLSVSL